MKLINFLPFPNYHVTSFVDELSNNSNFETSSFYFKKSPSYRVGNNWKGINSKSVLGNKYLFIKELFSSDIALFWGVSSPIPWQTLLFLVCALLNKRVFIMSEGLKDNNVGFKYQIMKLLFYMVKNKKVVLLAIGNGCNSDYRQLGFKGDSYKFSFFEKYPIYKEDDFKNDLNKYNSKSFKILLVGQLIVRKNFELVINSLSDYSGNKSVQVIIAGSGGEKKNLEQLAKSVNEKIEVFFLGHIESDELFKLYRKSHLFVCCSKYEGWGVVVNTALHFGLPILVTDKVRSGKNYLVEDKLNGIISSEIDFKNTLNQLINTDLKGYACHSYDYRDCWSIQQARIRFVEYINHSTAQRDGLFTKLSNRDVDE